MGCICSKESADEPVYEKEKQPVVSKSSVQLVAPSAREEVIVGVVNTKNEGSVTSKQSVSAPATEANSSVQPGRVEDNRKNRVIERPKNGHQRHFSTDMGMNIVQQPMSRIVSMPHGAKGEQVAAGWPSWLSSVAGEAIQGWVPRSAESFEKLDKASADSLFPLVSFIKIVPNFVHSSFQLFCCFRLLKFLVWFHVLKFGYSTFFKISSLIIV